MSTWKDRLTNPKFVHSVVMLVLGVFGFTAGTEVKELVSAPKVDVEVIVPEQPKAVEHNHKNWQPAIDAAVEKAGKEHEKNHHGGG